MATIAAAVIGAGAAYYGQQQQKKAIEKQQKMAAAQQEQALWMRPYMEAAMKSGWADLDTQRKWLQKFASGDRAEGLSAMAGDVENYNKGQDEALRSQTLLAGRGGGRSALLAGDAFRRQDALSRMYFGQRANAFDQLGKLGQGQLNFGLGAQGSILGGLQGAAGTQSDFLKNMLMGRQLDTHAWGEVGGGIADAMEQWRLRRTPGDSLSRLAGTSNSTGYTGAGGGGTFMGSGNIWPEFGGGRG